MAKGNTEEELDYWRLRSNCFKLAALVYLFKGQNPNDGLGEDEAHYGIGNILQEIHDDVLEVARGIENYQLRTAPKSDQSNRQKSSSK